MDLSEKVKDKIGAAYALGIMAAGVGIGVATYYKMFDYPQTEGYRTLLGIAGGYLSFLVFASPSAIYFKCKESREKRERDRSNAAASGVTTRSRPITHFYDSDYGGWSER